MVTPQPAPCQQLVAPSAPFICPLSLSARGQRFCPGCRGASAWPRLPRERSRGTSPAAMSGLTCRSLVGCSGRTRGLFFFCATSSAISRFQHPLPSGETENLFFSCHQFVNRPVFSHFTVSVKKPGSALKTQLSVSPAQRLSSSLTTGASHKLQDMVPLTLCTGSEDPLLHGLRCTPLSPGPSPEAFLLPG